MRKAGPKKVRSKVMNQRTSRQKASSKSGSLLKKNKKTSKPVKSLARISTPAGRVRPAPVVRQPTPEEIAHQAALVQFENGVNLFNKNEFQKARTVFERVASSLSYDLAERARVYMRICQQRLSHPPLQMKSAEDFYNYGVRMANEGNLEEAENAFTRALKLAPQADHVLYALASTQALKENVEGVLEYLEKAIQLNVRNRYLAQNDPDFSKLMEDPRFTEMIYPEEPLA